MMPERSVSSAWMSIALLATLIAGPSGCTDSVTDPRPGLAEPVLTFRGSTLTSTPGGDVVVYGLGLVNWAEYSGDLFTTRTDLPPCGLNESAARTWLEIFDDSGIHRYGYCAMNSPADLERFSVNVPASVEQPTSVYVELWDRELNVRVRSNPVSLR